MKIYPKMNSSNTALLVIDVVNSCVHQKCERPEWKIHFSKIRKMVPHLQEFIESYRKEVAGTIIFLNLVPWKKEFLPDNMNELYTDPKAYYYSKDDTGFSEQFYLLSPKKDDIVMTKNTYDTFTQRDFREFLTSKKIRYLIITGVFGDACVMATISGAFSNGYNLIILKDLIETMDHKIRQDLQKLLKEFTWPTLYGKTITSKEFLKAWGNNT